MQSHIPLAERMRPAKLDDFIGQNHLVAERGPLRLAIESGKIPSIIFWGPPGVGKTTLGYIIAQTIKRPFFHISAINAGVKDIRKVIDESATEVKPILFIDEIHRFNKAQQDSLLGAVEKGDITLIGATTENPSFEVISALLSRCQVYVLQTLTKDDLLMILTNAIEKDKILQAKKITVKEYSALFRISGGDSRKLLNLIELVVESEKKDTIEITDEKVTHYAQVNLALYDKGGEYHYDIISGFIKSIRGSDPNAAVYWLARMIESGEDPKFIARRMIILASEDIGNANPNALLLATACFQAVDMIGYPEARIILSQTATYLAASAKSNSAYMAIENALEKVKETGTLPVPLHLRNAPTRLMKELGYGMNYDYSHHHENHFAEQEYLPEGLEGTTFYFPSEIGNEKAIRDRIKMLWKDKYNT